MIFFYIIWQKYYWLIDWLKIIMKMYIFINLRCGENILYTIWCFYTHYVKKVLILQGVNKIIF